MSTEPAQTPPQPEPQPFTRVLEGNYHPCDYPEDAAHENGNYATKCQCGTVFIGHKRRMICKVCAETPPPQPEPQRCENCDWTFGCFDGSEPCQKKPVQPEPQQSAGEWVRQRWLRVEMPQYDHGHGLALHESDALELAERCEDAEHQAISMRQKADAFEKVAHQLNAQLANAQAAELEAAPTPLPRPDRAGDWWQWHKPTQSWILCHVTNLDYWGEALWLPATPPPAPKNEEGQG